MSFWQKLLFSKYWERKSDMNDLLIVVWYRIGETIKIMGFFNDWTEAHHWGDCLAQQKIIDEYRVYKLVTLEKP